jgi:hypothetical protein
LIATYSLLTQRGNLMKTSCSESLTVLTAQVDTVVSLLDSKGVIIALSAITKNDDGTCTFSLGAPQCTLRTCLSSTMDHLRDSNISYSYLWREGVAGGETHYRHNGDFGQHWSWLDCDKNTINIEDVRAAMTEGDTAVFELLDLTEARYTPWTWQDVSA